MVLPYCDLLLTMLLIMDFQESSQVTGQKIGYYDYNHMGHYYKNKVKVHNRFGNPEDSSYSFQVFKISKLYHFKIFLQGCLLQSYWSYMSQKIGLFFESVVEGYEILAV